MSLRLHRFGYIIQLVWYAIFCVALGAVIYIIKFPLAMQIYSSLAAVYAVLIVFRYKLLRVTLDENELKIERGVLFYKKKIIATPHIVSVQSYASPLCRLFGCYFVLVSTSSTRMLIFGLTKQNVLALLKLATQQVSADFDILHADDHGFRYKAPARLRNVPPAKPLEPLAAQYEQADLDDEADDEMDGDLG